MIETIGNALKGRAGTAHSGHFHKMVQSNTSPADHANKTREIKQKL
jgi:hypothetical protein